MTKKILCPIDGNAHSQIALIAADVAARAHCSVTVAR